ncbi:hypothetical protein [Roseibium sp. LAB1]
MRILQIACGVIFFAVTMYYGYIMFSVANVANTVFGFKSDPLEGQATVHNARHGSAGSFKDGYIALTDFKSLDAGRVANVVIPVSVKELLKETGAPADMDMIEVFISGQAPKIAEAECRLLIKTIASSCRVKLTKAKQFKDDPNFAEIRMQLQFLEKREPGTFRTEKPLNYQEVEADLLESAGIYAEAWLNEFKSRRAKLYASAARACDPLRRQHGNCSVTEINVFGQWKKREEFVVMRSNATLSYLWPERI